MLAAQRFKCTLRQRWPSRSRRRRDALDSGHERLDLVPHRRVGRAKLGNLCVVLNISMESYQLARTGLAEMPCWFARRTSVSCRSITAASMAKEQSRKCAASSRRATWAEQPSLAPKRAYGCDGHSAVSPTLVHMRGRPRAYRACGHGTGAHWQSVARCDDSCRRNTLSRQCVQATDAAGHSSRACRW